PDWPCAKAVCESITTAVDATAIINVRAMDPLLCWRGVDSEPCLDANIVWFPGMVRPPWAAHPAGSSELNLTPIPGASERRSDASPGQSAPAAVPTRSGVRSWH